MNIAQIHVFNMIVCAEQSYSLEEVIKYAEKENPCGTSGGWVNSTEEYNSPIGKVTSPCPCDEGAKWHHWILVPGIKT